MRTAGTPRSTKASTSLFLTSDFISKGGETSEPMSALKPDSATAFAIWTAEVGLCRDEN